MTTCAYLPCGQPIPNPKIINGAKQRFCSRSCSARFNAQANRGNHLASRRQTVCGVKEVRTKGAGTRGVGHNKFA